MRIYCMSAPCHGENYGFDWKISADITCAGNFYVVRNFYDILIVGRWPHGRQEPFAIQPFQTMVVIGLIGFICDQPAGRTHN